MKAYFISSGSAKRALSYEWPSGTSFVQRDYSTARASTTMESEASTWTQEKAVSDFPLVRLDDVKGGYWARVSRCDFCRFLKTNGLKP